jgi:CubicO group peptidase (beta-lactamase class C family)
LSLIAFSASIGPAYGQTSESAKQRMEAVQEHLSRYVILKGSDNNDMRLAPQMAALHVPADSMAAIRDGRIDWVQALGVSSLGGAPISPRTLFGAASISKSVAALGVLKLVEEHRIELDVDVNQYLKRWKIPDSPFTVEKKVTVGELLNHTSGIGTHNGEIYDPSLPIPTLLQLLNGEKPARTAPVRVEAVPGTKFAYSNGGYLVLYLLVEDVTGEPFAKFMKRTVFRPIGMKDSTFDAPLSPRCASRAATAYWVDGKSALPPSKCVEPNLAAGGLWTTPTDLAKFLIEVQAEYAGTSHKVLNQSTIQLVPKRGLGPWGLGFRVGGEPGNIYVSHEGSAAFQDDMFAYLHGGGFIVMTSGGDGGKLTEQLFRSAGKVYDFPDFKPIERSPVTVSSEVLSSYVGTYGFVKVAMDGDTLTAEIPAGSTPARLYAESPTHFFVLDGPQELLFTVDDQQEVTGVDFITPINRRPLIKTQQK